MSAAAASMPTQSGGRRLMSRIAELRAWLFLVC
jgi:hypothetical protein